MKCEHCGKEVDAKMITWGFHYLLGICPECGGIIVLERGCDYERTSNLHRCRQDPDS